MKHAFALALAAASLVAWPLFAGPPAKRPSCQVTKSPAREVKRPEACRRLTIPPVIDPAPMFLISTRASPTAPSDLT